MFYVVTPNRNYGRFLGDAIESVRLQGVDVRHHVQDTCSTDDSAAVAGRRAWAGLVFIAEPDSGLCDGFNRALARAPLQARYVGWLNSDEFYLPGTLAAVGTAFERHPDLDVVYGDTLRVDEHGRVQRLVAQHRYSPLVLRSLRHLHMQTASTFFRADLLERGLLRLDPVFRQTMDHELMVRLADRGCRFGHLPRPLSCFRVHGAQLTAHNGHEVARAEYELIVDRYRIRPRPLAARARHRALKLANRGYGRELAALVGRGRSVRWFVGPAERRLADRVVEGRAR